MQQVFPHISFYKWLNVLQSYYTWTVALRGFVCCPIACKSCRGNLECKKGNPEEILSFFTE